MSPLPAEPSAARLSEPEPDGGREADLIPAEPGPHAAEPVPETAPAIVIEPEPHEAPAARPRANRRAAHKARKTGRPASRHRQAKARPKRLGRLAVACLALLAFAVPSLLAGRAAVVRALPRSATLFAALGLPVNLAGFEIEQVASSLGQEGDASVLLVEGSVRNVTGASRKTPVLVLGIEAENGAPLYSWSVKVPEAELAAGEATPFRARLATPPPAGRRVTVTFRDGPDDRTVALR